MVKLAALIVYVSKFMFCAERIQSKQNYIYRFDPL